jgi:hypothetical protein
MEVRDMATAPGVNRRSRILPWQRDRFNEVADEESKTAIVPLDFEASAGRHVKLRGEPRQIATDGGPPLW